MLTSNVKTVEIVTFFMVVEVLLYLFMTFRLQMLILATFFPMSEVPEDQIDIIGVSKCINGNILSKYNCNL